MSSIEPTETLDGIAIIGMAGRFPGARSVDELWRNLCAGVESISFFTPDELRAAGVPPEVYQQPNYVPARGALGDAEYFDAAFFGHSPSVAALMDPQHRLFLECAWTALEHAGYDSERCDGRIGVFGGESLNTYLLNNVISHMRMVASVDSLQASIGNDKDSLTTEVAYKLNLTGPSVTVQTASSTSLAAVHLACQSLLSYECDMALAGGVSIHFPEPAGYLYQEGGATSPDGHCRAFDADARGFVNGHGAAIVVLKRLEGALEDGDTVYAVIRGSAINNDGALKVSYMAPSVDGQAAVIAMAQAVAGVEPETIGYVEAHGTGTNLGDPIELAALTQAFRAGTDRRGYCAIGSLKTNIGHLDTAAGAAGLIKAALSLAHRRIPPSLHFRAPNPQIDFAGSPFYVNTSLAEWPAADHPRRAGVSSFGMGGTNVHVVLEEAPAPTPGAPARPWQLLTLSAKTSTALEQQTANLAAHLRAHPELDLADVAYTLQLGRRAIPYRRALVCADLADAAQALERGDPERLLTSYQEPGERSVVFMFSGQGAQYQGMAAGLYGDEPAFRAELDRCAELLRPHLDLDLRDLLFGAGGADPALLGQTRYAQPALFAVEYALARLWMGWGVQPKALIGHSVGEYVAACLAGVFSLEDGLALVAARGRLMQALPPGAMLAVPLPEAELRPLLGDRLALAAVNGPELATVSGPADAVEALERLLAARGLPCRRLHTSHAFHSAMMDPILAPFAELVRGVALRAPELPYLSNVTGGWIKAEEATSPDYWAAHLRQAVRFADGVGELLRDPQAALLELGPGQTLATLARQHPARHAGQPVVSALRHPQDAQPDRAFLLGAVARLWLAGVTVDAAQLYAGKGRRRVPLPTYPFERQRYWLEPLKGAEPAPAATSLRRPDIADWFSVPIWKPSLAPRPDLEAPPRRWLLFADSCGVSARLAQALAQAGHEVVTVREGAGFDRIDDRLYTIDGGERLDYELLLAELGGQGLLPDAIVHAWSLRPADEVPPDFATAQVGGFFSMLWLAQALGAQAGARAVQITALTSGAQRLGGEAALAPAQATILGLCKVIPQEYPQLACQCIDLALPPPEGWQAARLTEALVGACLTPTPGGALAYRDGQLWQQGYAPAPLHTAAGGIREGGAYLITGGFGGIGLAIARRLAGAKARLALLARTELPPRAEWDAWLAAHDDELAQRIAAVRELEALGAEVLPIAADVTSPAQLREALAQVEARFGQLNGALHAAGLVGRRYFQTIQEADAEACTQHFQAKVHGTVALAEALAGRRLDVCMLFSSLSTVLGGLGFGAYAAANCFMDAFAQAQRLREPTPWVSVSWDAWELTERQRQGLSAQQQAGEFAMSGEDGAEAFARILAAGAPPRVIVSTGDLEARLSRWVALEQLREPAQDAQPAPGSAHPRPNLPTPYIAPRNPTEAALAELWQAVLGLERVGIHDNFFDLGGNSLSGITLIGRVKARFDVQLPTVSLYEGPTVSALAQLIGQGEAPASEPEASRSRGERRRERRRSARMKDEG